nr:immunoglobulin heavy chain junction region [Mus musculus]
CTVKKDDYEFAYW